MRKVLLLWTLSSKKKRQNPPWPRLGGLGVTLFGGVPRKDGTREKRPRDNNRVQCLASSDDATVGIPRHPLLPINIGVSEDARLWEAPS